MAHTITAYAFIDQQAPVVGQLCVVRVYDEITSKDKYRIRYLPTGLFGRSIEADCREAAQRGSRLPDTLGQAIVLEIGEEPDQPIPVTF